MSLLSLFVLVPLAFMLAAILAGRRGAWLVFAAVPVMLVLSVRLVLAMGGEAPGGALGGWPAPLGIRLQASGFSAALLVAANLTAGLAGLHAFGEMRMTGHGAGVRASTFWPLYFGLWAAAGAILVSNDVFNLYVALELLTVAAVALAAYGSREAALRYFLIAMPASLAFLLGVVLLYARYGALDLDLIAGRAVADLPTLLAAALMSAGLLAKGAVFPLHAWLPPAHAAAPAPASALLSGLVVKAAVFILVRLWFDALPGLAVPALLHAFGALGAMAVIYGSVLALLQERLKRLVAYSTVAQLGYLLLVFPLAGGAQGAAPWAAGAWGAMALHALSHMLSKAGMFLAAGLIVHCAGEDRIARLDGIARAMPVTVLGFAVCAVSLMGLPPSGGFMAKYLFLVSALAAELWIYALVIVAGGLLAAAYLFRPLTHFMDGHHVPEVSTCPSRLLPALPLVLGLAAVGLGIASSAPYSFVQIGALAGGTSQASGDLP
ncbi:hypothetical protein E5163_11955 [Marinicauda algicola]|uniref:NADH:quinone oxidoreductase/Mrp antiporter transmembrane domain-containing protein n=1 Tax=Marinicauda algicola TaxID=2029849 RepID=A0A4S2H019_9PROT|nr:proton-conducting transporter membrane subunit [Marinicauda algicola]TGY88521.1 hypothetical protein E5163_11955 [Marinicauda algicola]